MDYRERWELKDYLIGRRLARRILLFHVGFALLLLGFLLNFWYLQGVNGATYASLAEDNRLRRIPIHATRGEIYDRNRQIIASTRPSLDLLLRREGPHELDTQLERLAVILGQPANELHDRLETVADRPDFEPLLVREDIRLHELAQIEARRELFPSVEIREGRRRHYPASELVSHAVGYVGQVSESQLAGSGGKLQRGDIVGKSGVERSFDEALRGDRGWKLVSVNNLGRQIGGGRVERAPGHGNSMALTIDLSMQQALKRALADEAGAGVFMDPRTGEILAMASTPSFDPNLFADGFTHEEWQLMADDPRQPLHDRAIASFYAPGSTFKVVLAIAGLETGTIQPTERVFCNGSTKIYKRRRLCWKRGGHGWVDLRSALTHSCNVYFYHLGKKLTIDPIHTYGKKFGLGDLSGIDVPGEERGILPSREWKLRIQGERWYPGDTISVAIGQGLLAVTPVQMARMISGVATGRLPQPHLRADAAVEPRELDIAPATMSHVRHALERAVSQGTGREATLGTFSVAGKTGTAQVYKHSAGVDSNDLPKDERDHAWFVGYAPANDPQIAFAVIVEHGGHGGSMAAPIARKVLEVFFDSGAPGEQSREGELRAGRIRSGEYGSVRSPAAR